MSDDMHGNSSRVVLFIGSNAVFVLEAGFGGASLLASSRD